MNFLLGLQVGFKEILAHKFRSFLTMLGVILGVASLMAMFAVTEGIARGMRETLEARGGVELVEVEDSEVSVENEQFAFLSPGRTMEDVAAIRKGVPLVGIVTPEIWRGARIAAGAEFINQRIFGTTASFAELYEMTVDVGRNLCDLDEIHTHRVATVGANIVERLWPGKQAADVLGETILINQRPFTVVGVYRRMETESAKRARELGTTKERQERRERRGKEVRSHDPYYHQNNAVLIPVSAMFLEFRSAENLGNNYIGPNYKLDRIRFQIKDIRHFEEAIEQVQNVLLRTHRGIDDFGFDTREDWFDSIETSVRSTRISGSLIAGISLLVGGIGIANIMMASITERIREIGVRRAVGATSRDIFVQIVVEASVIGFIGGIIGLLTAIGFIEILATLSPETNPPALTGKAFVISFSSAVLIGIVSGLYPASKASRLDPIEALRYG
jgi:putative ABC transport system permease protein